MDQSGMNLSFPVVIGIAIQSTRSLHKTVSGFKDRSRCIQRLQAELEAVTNVLESLKKVDNFATSILASLHCLCHRCGEICCKIERLMIVFSQTPITGFRDWTKMQFVGGDINEFIGTIGGYRSTISVSLGILTMHTSKVPQEVLQQYNEMIKDTTYNLMAHLRLVEEKVQSNLKNNASDINLNFKDEEEVTKQCIRICEYAGSRIGYPKTRDAIVSNVYLGNVVALGSEQTLVATSPGHFVVRTAISSGNSRQFVGSMKEEDIKNM
ncbi:uncharacterized protein N7511_008448 [Penicillium nucicola]|uniref:uncharacterized protein n=1 Tax=Penicillium nucicola TaxID=1850975 RepID=UPI002544D575|nr:uncharacterized protein N7511_008448 [Penicillium nucicola]KAJ5751483.1 hypothetical protein N7511_008448 [Penicillium nucicola]